MRCWLCRVVLLLLLVVFIYCCVFVCKIHRKIDTVVSVSSRHAARSKIFEKEREGRERGRERERENVFEFEYEFKFL